MNKYMPLAIEMTGKKCLVIGGGKVATRKMLSLIKAGAIVIVISPKVSGEINVASEAGLLNWQKREFTHGDFEDLQHCDFIVASSDDSKFNEEIADHCEKENLLCCLVSNAKKTRVLFPSTIRQDGLCVSVHTDGADCKRSKRVSGEISEYLNGSQKSMPRRGRKSPALRRLSNENNLCSDDLILPLFIVDGENNSSPIESMPGVNRMSVDLAVKYIEGVDVPAVLLFGVVDESLKDENASAAMGEKSIVAKAIRAIKKARPEIAVITDVCVCGYTPHGHCGVVDENGNVENEPSLKLLCKMALSHACAGADIVAPSAMMDLQVQAIRKALDENGFSDMTIMSYSTKFASSFYGPFRDAANSSPSFGDRKNYQLQPSNRQEAIRESLLDQQQGADWLMVKPGMAYLDIIRDIREKTHLPIAAYQVSGEYAMLKHASSAGAIDEKQAVLESLTSFKRSGANAIITYYAKEVATWLGQ